MPFNSALTSSNVAGAFHATLAGQQLTLLRTAPAVCRALYGNSACDGTP
jgi:hypothetical protein